MNERNNGEIIKDRNFIKIPYSKLRQKFLKCELEKEDKNSREECRRAFKELNIELFDD